MNTESLMNEIAEHEGKVLHCYECSMGYKTIGVGHKVLESDPESALDVFGAYDSDIPTIQSISEERCQELFKQDVQTAIDGCKRIYKNWESFPEEFQRILVNMCFQLGAAGLSKFKNMNAAAEEMAYGQVALEMEDSRWARQTPHRMEALKARVWGLAD